MKYVMNLNQFMFLKDQAIKNSAIDSLDQANQTDGVINTHDVTINYNFDGSTLNYQVAKRKTLAAKIAGDSFLEKHIDEVILEVLATQPAVEAEKAKQDAAKTQGGEKVNERTECK